MGDYLILDALNNGCSAFAASLVETVAEKNPDADAFNLLAVATEILSQLVSDLGPTAGAIMWRLPGAVREQAARRTRA